MPHFNKPIKNAEAPVQITWTQEMFARLKRHYNHAVETRQETFVFNGHGFLTAYAKHLIAVLAKEFP